MVPLYWFYNFECIFNIFHSIAVSLYAKPLEICVHKISIGYILKGTGYVY